MDEAVFQQKDTTGTVDERKREPNPQEVDDLLDRLTHDVSFRAGYAQAWNGCLQVLYDLCDAEQGIALLLALANHERINPQVRTGFMKHENLEDVVHDSTKATQPKLG